MPQLIHPLTDTERWIVSSAVKERTAGKSRSRTSKLKSACTSTTAN